MYLRFYCKRKFNACQALISGFVYTIQSVNRAASAVCCCAGGKGPAVRRRPLPPARPPSPPRSHITSSFAPPAAAERPASPMRDPPCRVKRTFAQRRESRAVAGAGADAGRRSRLSHGPLRLLTPDDAHTLPAWPGGVGHRPLSTPRARPAASDGIQAPARCRCQKSQRAEKIGHCSQRVYSRSAPRAGAGGCVFSCSWAVVRQQRSGVIPTPPRARGVEIKVEEG